VDILRDACPNTVPLTPVGRLEVMKQRLDAMIAAANAVRPALEDFYASLTDEQKAKFNRLGRQTAQSGGWTGGAISWRGRLRPPSLLRVWFSRQVCPLAH